MAARYSVMALGESFSFSAMRGAGEWRSAAAGRTGAVWVCASAPAGGFSAGGEGCGAELDGAVRGGGCVTDGFWGCGFAGSCCSVGSCARARPALNARAMARVRRVHIRAYDEYSGLIMREAKGEGNVHHETQRRREDLSNRR